MILFAFTLRVVVESLPLGWVFIAVGLALVMSLFFTLTSADELTEARLVKHGFVAGTGKAVRHRAGRPPSAN